MKRGRPKKNPDSKHTTNPNKKYKNISQKDADDHLFNGGLIDRELLKNIKIKKKKVNSQQNTNNPISTETILHQSSPQTKKKGGRKKNISNTNVGRKRGPKKNEFVLNSIDTFEVYNSIRKLAENDEHVQSIIKNIKNQFTQLKDEIQKRKYLMKKKVLQEKDFREENHNIKEYEKNESDRIYQETIERFKAYQVKGFENISQLKRKFLKRKRQEIKNKEEKKKISLDEIESDSDLQNDPKYSQQWSTRRLDLIEVLKKIIDQPVNFQEIKKASQIVQAMDKSDKSEKGKPFHINSNTIYDHEETIKKIYLNEQIDYNEVEFKKKILNSINEYYIPPKEVTPVEENLMPFENNKISKYKSILGKSFEEITDEDITFLSFIANQCIGIIQLSREPIDPSSMEINPSELLEYMRKCS